jgi:2-succinyl-6-hydroxy-2,4-cyclohexadiene-1-carboxylate synthase
MAADWSPLGGALGAQRTGTGPRVVFVHGFTQTGASWAPVAERVAAAGHEVVVVDLPGHGASANVRADLRRIADLLAATTGTATYVGYSLGGRVCLHLALMYPHIVERLVLIGATPGIDDDEARAERRTADDALADRIVEIGTEAFLAEWMAQPLFDGLVPDPADMAARKENSPAGLASSLRLAGTGTQLPLRDRLHELNMPVLTVAGARDTKFVPIAEQIAATVADGEFVAVADAGHAAHLQRPDTVATLLVDWLQTSAIRR